MDGFTLLILGFGALAFGAFYLLGTYHPKSGPEVLDWKPTRSAELEAELELDDIDQMLEAQNRRRRESGRPELSEEGVRAELDAERRRAASDDRP